MQLTVVELGRAVTEDEPTSHETLSIPLVGFINGSLISVALWAVFIWTLFRIVG